MLSAILIIGNVSSDEVEKITGRKFMKVVGGIWGAQDFDDDSYMINAKVEGQTRIHNCT